MHGAIIWILNEITTLQIKMYDCHSNSLTLILYIIKISAFIDTHVRKLSYWNIVETAHDFKQIYIII